LIDYDKDDLRLKCEDISAANDEMDFTRKS
jgi:hypothetical protein